MTFIGSVYLVEQVLHPLKRLPRRPSTDKSKSESSGVDEIRDWGYYGRNIKVWTNQTSMQNTINIQQHPCPDATRSTEVQLVAGVEQGREGRLASLARTDRQARTGLRRAVKGRSSKMRRGTVRDTGRARPLDRRE